MAERRQTAATDATTPGRHRSPGRANRTNGAGDTVLIERRTFWLLVIAVSVAFGWVVLPFYGAILWGAILAILFAPFHRAVLARSRGKRGIAAFATIVVIVVIVILPLAVLATVLAQETLDLLHRMQSGDIDVGAFAQRSFDALPAWTREALDRIGLADVASLKQRLAAGATRALQAVAPHAVDVGQGTIEVVVGFFVMLYLLFFLLRDADAIARRLRATVPLSEAVQRDMWRHFAAAIRATIKGTLFVAVAQGTLGGLVFWLLGIHAPLVWGVVMAFASLVPAVGPALVWLPVAAYLLLSGATWHGIGLIVYGTVVIGLVDNVARPMLVGKEARMPDYVVLVTSLGGLAIFGMNGFVIGPIIAALFISAWSIVAASRLES